MKCIEDEIPFEVPEGWAWTRMYVICPYGECENIDADLIDDNEWILDLEDIEKETGIILVHVKKKERPAKSTKHKFRSGQLLYSKLRPYLNKVVIADANGYCTSEILPLKFRGNILPQYMQVFLMSDTFLSYVNMIAYGLKMPRLGTNDGLKALVALPPLDEQKRIVDRVFQALIITDEIALAKNDLSVTIAQIKTKVLNLAIHGKLVPQDPNDEPASVLLERIRAEKEELIKAAKSNVIRRNPSSSVVRITLIMRR